MTARVRPGPAALAAPALLLAASPAHACPYCGAGGRDAWVFIVVVVGAFVAAGAMLLVWSIRSGRGADPEAPARRMLELDRETGVKR